MVRKLVAVNIAVGFVLLASGSVVAAPHAPHRHPGPWPIWQWRNHQPTQKQLDALHARDVSPKEAKELDRLYDQLEGRPPSILAPEQH